MHHKFDFIVVGGGIVGLATAYKLQMKYPKKTIAVLEKEHKLGMHQTGRNSGVIHSGIYYPPGSYKAKNCKNGRDQLVAFAEKHNVKYDNIGKIIVAVSKSEIPLLDIIYNKGLANGTPGIKLLNPSEIKIKEPFIEGLKAIWVPTAGIIDYVEVCEKFVKEITTINSESKFIHSCKVLSVDNSIIKTTKGLFEASKIIFCGGLNADRLAKKDKIDAKLKIVGFRGDYYKLVDKAKHKVNNLVYPTPDPNFPFLGVHFTPMVDGSIECGPNAVFSFKREGYKTTSFSFIDSFQALTYKGTWRLFFKHWRKGVEEYRRAFSKRLFVKELQRMMPTIKMSDVVYARAGVRAQALDFNGSLVDDFKIEERNNHIHVLNAPSPAATSCLAIADEIVIKV